MVMKVTQTEMTEETLNWLMNTNMRIFQNTFTLQDYLFSSNLGIGIYYPASFINHSCQPNAVQIYHKSRQHIIACRDIDVDEEITISYSDSGEILKKRR